METRDLPRLGELVRRHRTAVALSQEELAERAGLSVRAISDLEACTARPGWRPCDWLQMPLGSVSWTGPSCWLRRVLTLWPRSAASESNRILRFYSRFPRRA